MRTHDFNEKISKKILSLEVMAAIDFRFTRYDFKGKKKWFKNYDPYPYTGKLNQKVEPLFSWLAKPICPP